jgi:hypothetical protein
VSEAIVHFEHARQIVQEVSPAEMPGNMEINDLYLQLVRVYESGGHTEKALALEAERENILGE